MNKYRLLLRNILRRLEADWSGNAEPRVGGENWWLQQYKEWVAAVRFLSTVPWPGSARLFSTAEADPHLIVGSGYFSLVGELLALLLSLLPFLLGGHVPSLVLAAILLVAQILLTGGLHLDGLMDSCDGLFSGRDVERKLEIMRDSRVGGFGVLGAGCVLLVKFACYASLSVHILPLVLLSVLPSARWAMLLAVYVFPNARSTGLGPTFRRTVTMPRLVCTGLLALIFALIWGHLAGLFIWIAATGSALLMGVWIVRVLLQYPQSGPEKTESKSLPSNALQTDNVYGGKPKMSSGFATGGLTGDTYGAIEEATECIVLLLTFFLLAWF